MECSEIERRSITVEEVERMVIKQPSPGLNYNIILRAAIVSLCINLHN